jgi:hypothetical protein
VAVVIARDEHTAHGIQGTPKEWQFRIAEVSRVLLEQCWYKKALEENVCFTGGQFNSIMLAQAHGASFVFQIVRPDLVFGGINASVQKGARRVGVHEKSLKLLFGSKRLPFIQSRTVFAHDGAINLVLDQTLYLINCAWL